MLPKYIGYYMCFLLLYVKDNIYLVVLEVIQTDMGFTTETHTQSNRNLLSLQI